jgi:hypothetical protein
MCRNSSKGGIKQNKNAITDKIKEAHKKGVKQGKSREERQLL